MVLEDSIVNDIVDFINKNNFYFDCSIKYKIIYAKEFIDYRYMLYDEAMILMGENCYELPYIVEVFNDKEAYKQIAEAAMLESL